MKSILTVKHADGTQEVTCKVCGSKMIWRDNGVAMSNTAGGLIEQDEGGFWECPNKKSHPRKMDRIGKQKRIDELNDMIIYRGIIEHKDSFADYPELNDELNKLQEELYQEEE